MSKETPYARHPLPIMIDGVLYIGKQYESASLTHSCKECAVDPGDRTCLAIGIALSDKAGEDGCNEGLVWRVGDTEEDQLFYMKHKLAGGE